ncbi:hypothetical protein WA158_007098 [Blastocystis sp. Blastoise]
MAANDDVHVHSVESDPSREFSPMNVYYRLESPIRLTPPPPPMMKTKSMKKTIILPTMLKKSNSADEIRNETMLNRRHSRLMRLYGHYLSESTEVINEDNPITDSFDIIDELSPDYMYPYESIGRLDLRENDKIYQVFIDLPGIKRKDIALKLIHNSLYLECHRFEEDDDHEYTYTIGERHYGRICRKIPFEEPVQIDQISAKFENGVLIILVPKRIDIVTTETPIEIS